MKIVIVFALTMLASCKTPYDKALEKCRAVCLPKVVRSVEYNFSNNRFDKCICNTNLEEKELE